MRRALLALVPFLCLAAHAAIAQNSQPTPTPYADLHARPYAYHGPGRNIAEPADLEDIRIGLFLPHAGPRAEAGRNLRRGFELAVAEANAGGGIHGLPVRLVIRPEDSPWGSAREVVRLAYEDRVLAVAGAVGGRSSHVVQQIATKAQLPLLAVATTDASLTEINIPWTFRLMPDDDAIAKRLADHITGERGHDHVLAVAADSPDSQRRLDAFRLHCAKNGTPNIRQPEASPIRKNQIGTVVTVFGNAEFAESVVSTLDNAFIIVIPEPSPTEFLAQLQTSPEGLTLVSPCDLKRESVALAGFKGHYRDRFQADPDEIAAFAYDGAQLIIKAIASAGLNRAKIRDALAEMPPTQGVTGDIVLDGSGGSSAEAVLMRVIPPR